MIHLGDLKPDTAMGLQGIADAHGWGDIQVWMSPEQVAWLTYRLKHVEDKPEWFPHGKWATIQRLQAMVDTFALSEHES